MQFCAAPEFNRGAGRKAAADGGVKRAHHGVKLGLDFVLRHARVNRRAGGALGVVRERQCEGDIAGSTVDGDALEFTALGLALRDVERADHAQAQASVVAGDVGHVHMGQRVAKAQQEGCAPPGRVGRVNRDGDVARTNGSQAFECDLDVVGQHRVVSAVRNVGTLDAVQRDLEAAAGQLRVDLQRSYFELGDIAAAQGATKAHAVRIGCAADVDRAQSAQCAVVAGLGFAQRSLQRSCTGSEVDVGCGVGLAGVAKAQTEHTMGGAFAVHREALYFGRGGHTVTEQFVRYLRAANADALVGNVGARQRADEAHDVALASPVAAVVDDADVGLGCSEQRGVGGLEVGCVLCSIAHHKDTGHRRGTGARTFGLQVDQVQVLPGQAAPCAQADLRAAERDTKLRTCDLAQTRINGGLDLRLVGVARDQGGAVALTQVGQCQAVALGLRIGAQADLLDLVDVGHTGGDGAHAGAGVAKSSLVEDDLAGVAVGQCATEADVQSDEVGVGLLGVVAHRDVARANVR